MSPHTSVLSLSHSPSVIVHFFLSLSTAQCPHCTASLSTQLPMLSQYQHCAVYIHHPLTNLPYPYKTAYLVVVVYTHTWTDIQTVNVHGDIVVLCEVLSIQLYVHMAVCLHACVCVIAFHCLVYIQRILSLSVYVRCQVRCLIHKTWYIIFDSKFIVECRSVCVRLRLHYYWKLCPKVISISRDSDNNIYTAVQYSRERLHMTMHNNIQA